MNQVLGMLFVVGFAAAQMSGQMSRESIGSTGTQANAASYEVAMSSDGRFVAFDSAATSLVTGTTARQIYLRDRQLLQTTVVSVSSGGAFANADCYHPAISGDGRFVAFASAATNLDPVSNGPLSIFVHDRVTGATQCASVSTAGVVGDIYSIEPVLSADGRWLAFTSRCGNLIDGLVLLPTAERVYVRDLQAATTIAVSVDLSGAIVPAFRPAISGDGRYVSFISYASTLVANDGNGTADVFSRDLVSGTTEAISVTPAGATGSSYSTRSSVSGDGRYVAFASRAVDLVSFLALNGTQEMFLRDRLTQTTQLVSADQNGGASAGWCDWPTVSADGLHVAFSECCSGLVSGDVNGQTDVFVRDLLPGVTRLLSRASDGTQGNGPSPSGGSIGIPIATAGPHARIAIAADGRFVAFSSLASNLVPGDTNAVEDAFVADGGCRVQYAEFGQGLAGSAGGIPILVGLDGPCSGQAPIVLAGALGGATAFVAVGFVRAEPPAAALGGSIYVDLWQPFLVASVTLAGVSGIPYGGSFVVAGIDYSGLEGLTLYLQAVVVDPAAYAGYAMTNALSMSIL